MANPERGEVALTVGDRTYRLVLDLNALCELEDLLSTPDQAVTFGQVFLHASQYSGRHCRAIAWAALRRYHPDLSLADAADVIQAAGGIDEFFQTIAKLKKATEVEGDKGRPRKARQAAGTGGRTSSTPNGSASAKTSSGD